MLGAVVSPIAGIALFVGAVAGALIWEFMTADPDRRKPLQEAMALGRQNAIDGTRQVLVVANRTLASDELRTEIADPRPRGGAGAPRRADPVLAGALHRVGHRW